MGNLALGQSKQTKDQERRRMPRKFEAAVVGKVPDGSAMGMVWLMPLITYALPPMSDMVLL